MANLVPLGGQGTLFVGEDKTLRWEVLDTSSVPVDLGGWNLTFDVRLSDTSATSILSKTATVTGSYNATRASNTQRAVVTLSDTEMNVFKPRPYAYSLKRMDDASETVLAYGPFTPEKATAP